MLRVLTAGSRSARALRHLNTVKNDKCTLSILGTTQYFQYIPLRYRLLQCKKTIKLEYVEKVIFILEVCIR